MTLLTYHILLYHILFLKSDYVNSDGVPTEYTREVINHISGTEYDKEVYDKSEVSFTYLEDIPNVRYCK